ncbi:MAG: Wzz/FepE/Etk N-terminal domain-containing protein [Patescibacteria group bacterium]
MEIKDLTSQIKKNLIFIAIITLVASSVGFSSTKFLKSGYQQQTLLFVKVQDKNTLSENSPRVDSSNLTDTTVAILQSPDFASGADLGESQLEVRKMAPQVIRITVTAKNKDVSSQTSTKVIYSYNEKIKNLVPQANIELVGVGIPNDPTRQVLNSKIMAAFGASLGFIASLSILALAKYLKL